MKKRYGMVGWLFLFLLCGCASVLPSPAAGRTAETARQAPASTAPAPAPATAEQAAVALPDTVEALDLAVLPYDEIRLVYHYQLFDPPVPGYYTMSRAGRWGLMRNDGSEILPCIFASPVAMCSDSTPETPAWIVDTGQADEAQVDRAQQYLTAVGEGRICGTAHCGPGYEYYLWDEGTQQIFAYVGSLGPGEPSHISPRMCAERGWWFPTQPGSVVEEEWGLSASYDTTAPYRYRSAEGVPLNNYAYQQAELFYDGALLAAARRGERWVYLDGSGNEVTAPSYDPVYWNVWAPDTGYASPLLSGYAAVSRNGQFGLLDSAGFEYLPCGYAGVAWDGRLGWLKLADGWHAFRLATAAVPTARPAPTGDPLRGVPLTTVFPDTYPGLGRRVDYTTIRDDNLNVRAGPGTQYDKIGSIPPGSPVEELGTSSTVGGWTFVRYQDWLRGWVSNDYLE